MLLVKINSFNNNSNGDDDDNNYNNTMQVFSLMVTYLIVFLQMAQANSNASSGSQAAFNSTTNSSWTE